MLHPYLDLFDVSYRMGVFRGFKQEGYPSKNRPCGSRFSDPKKPSRPAERYRKRTAVCNRVCAIIGGWRNSSRSLQGRAGCKKRRPSFSTIDPRSFEQAVKQAEAAIAKDKVQAENGRAQAVRYKSLIEKNLIAQDQYDQMRTNAESFDATLCR